MTTSTTPAAARPVALARARHLKPPEFLGACLLAVCIGLQAMYSSFLLFGSRAVTAEEIKTFTLNGIVWYHPERELPIYAAGCALTVALCVVFSKMQERARGRADAAAALETWPLNTLYMGMSVAGAALFFPLFFVLQRLQQQSHLSALFLLLLLCAPAALQAAGFAFSLRSGVPLKLFLRLTRLDTSVAAARVFRPEPPDTQRTNDRAEPRSGDEELQSSDQQSSDQLETPAPFVLHWLDLLVPMLLFGLVYLPAPSIAAGRDFADQAFHHWDYYAIGPAIQYQRGMALGAQAYSQYGVGWPVLLAALSPVISLGYGHAMWIAALWCWLYFVGVYAFLRLLLGDALWACVGVFAAISIQMFSGILGGQMLLQYPSSSVLRSPLDIWFFMALLLYARSRRVAWLLLMGILNGLALLFGTDTGAYLTVAFCACHILLPAARILPQAASRRAALSKLALALLGCWLTIGTTLLAGLYIASRGTLTQPGFLKGWLEVFWMYPSGISMSPIAAQASGVVLSFAVMYVYLGTVGVLALKLLRGRMRRLDVIFAVLAIYGLSSLLLYVGRSHWFNIFHVSVPLTLLVVSGCHALAQRRPDRQAQSGSESGTFRALQALAFGLAFLVFNPNVLRYPGLIQTMLRRVAQRHTSPPVCFMPEANDVCVPSEYFLDSGPFRAAVADMRALKRKGYTSAVLVNDDPSYYLASGVKPVFRYAPLLPILLKKSQVREVSDQIAAHCVDYVFVPRQNPLTHPIHKITFPFDTTDAWLQLRAAVHAAYLFDHDCGEFEVWKRRSFGPGQIPDRRGAAR